ncbi:Tad domain-containing protein [Altererythrobacter sp. KTW20L]|uniref:Tad domain-containing protein n=1 Tax=Altererythrobacter sp. KTW20L TaxID=2942210 RepID=UPI0020C10847|nr:Tad domain-containing protein [Altererythrobacter sp. KTW20L]MCL6251486.1 Tad domain-containing protein [Altererythrobacter sp. KTW20L]
MRIKTLPIALFRALMRDLTAGVTTLATLALPVLIGAGGLAFDLNRGYQQRVISQRAADMAALGTAMAFVQSQSAGILNPTAQDIVLANGLADSTVAASLVADYPTAGNQAVRVTIDSELPFSLASVLGFSGTFGVSVESYASLNSTPDFAAPCFLALDGGSAAISVTGGASINAPTCSIAAVGTIENKGQLIRGADIISGSADVTVNYGTLDANTLRYAGIFSAPAWNTNVPPAADRVNQPTTLVDPWATNAALLAAYDQIGDYQAPVTIAQPSLASGTNWNVRNNNPTSAISAFQQSNKAHFVFPAGTYNIGNLTIAGGMNVSFADGSTINVAGNVSIGGGSTVNFGNSDITVTGNFASGSSGVTIGDGGLWIGGSAKFEGTNSKGNGDVFIAGATDFWGGSTTVMGAGDHLFGAVGVGGGGKVRLGAGRFQATSGVNMSGDSELALGNGNVVIGPGNGNNAIKMMGSARFFMGDGTFSANGSIDTAGGTRLVFGQTANHYINGDLKPKGSVLFGRGRYTIAGDFENGTGGTTWPYTSSLTGQTYGDVVEGVSGSGYDMVGVDVTFILGGVIKLAGGARTRLYAATYSTTGAQISELLASSQSSDDANWTGGSVNSFSGTIHFPNAQVKMAGGNTTDPNGRCMTLIADTIRVNGGAAAGTACNMMDNSIGGGGGNASIRIIG